MASKPGFPEILAFGPTGYGDELLWGAAMSLSIAVLAYALGLLIGFAGAMSASCAAARSPGASGWLHHAGARRAGTVLILILYLCRHGDAEPAAGELRAWRPSPSTASRPPCWCWASCRAPIRRKCCAPPSRPFPWGQIEAARAYRHVALARLPPHHAAGDAALRLPGLANLWLIVTKDTALIAVVGYTELALATRQAAGNTKMYFTFFIVGGPHLSRHHARLAARLRHAGEARSPRPADAGMSEAP